MVSGHNYPVQVMGSSGVGAQGAFYFPKLDNEEGVEGVEGVYVYPDWSSCVSGTWRHYTLVRGRYCRVTGAEEAGAGLVLHTAPLQHSPALAYSPPSYTSFGLPPTQRDPFENSTVAVRESVIGDVMEARDKGQGLFTVREVRRGEVVSFYSGYVIKNEQVLSKLTSRIMSVVALRDIR